MPADTRPGRLEGKIALITGGAGTIGEVITRRYLAEGASVAITGRNAAKLDAYRRRLIEDEGISPERVLAVRMDGSDMGEVRAGVAAVVACFGRVDVLVNNAGSAGPRRRLRDIPLGREDLQPPDGESLLDTVGNLLGIAWNLVRAVAPHMPPGGSVINVSTIFSRTDYFGRIAYVVPKAALNALSVRLAEELGARGVRVNTVYPGPIESERIRTVFTAMDGLKDQPAGTTAAGFFDSMRLSRVDETGQVAKRFPTPADVAGTVVFLGSDESAAFAGHAFEVTHGMDVPAESRTTFVSRPGLRAVDATGAVILICAGDQAEDALDLADLLRACRATIAIGFRDPAARERAASLLQEERRPVSTDMYGRPTSAPPPLLLHLDPLDQHQTQRALDEVHKTLGGPHHALILPAFTSVERWALNVRNTDSKISYGSTQDAHPPTPTSDCHDDVQQTTPQRSTLNANTRNAPTPNTSATPPHPNTQRSTLNTPTPNAAAIPPRTNAQRSTPNAPTFNPHTDSLVSPNDPTVDAFLRHEIAGVVALASALDRFWATGEGDSHRVLFLTNLDDGRGNRFADLLRAGVEQLCRVWRHETPGVWCNQIIRYTSAEAAGRDFAAAWVARLLGSAKRIEEINLYLPERLAGAIGVHTPGFGYAESLFGLHMGKVALVTGGSAGIGGQIGRLLALSGALVMLTARRAEELERIRSEIIRALRDAGYPSPEARVHILADCDVSEPAMWERMVNHTLATLGRVDYLINNAGIAGAEEMVIDMPHDAWRHTLQANLISNYALIRALASQMKRHGGAILNVSSYFGGEKYVAIPYPNRADYAVSKAGQRALAEALARFLGPEVQINALAPGPVEGERLKGVGSRPGLFARRARLILENKRLNEIHAALINAHHDTGRPIADLLPALASNEVAPLAAEDAPAPLRRCARQILDSSDPQANSRMYLMNESIWKKLVRRLELGGYLARQEPRLKDESESPNISGPSSLIPHPASLQMPEPFFPPAQIEREATRVRNGVLSMLYLQRMPTEFDVALATVFYLADRNISGETFHPSGGLKFERTVTEGELFGKPGPQRLELLAGSTVFLIGEHLRQHLVALARCFLEEHAAARVVLITESEGGAHELLASLPEHANAGQLLALAAGDDIEGALDRARTVHGRPGPVVSTPFRPLPQSRLAAPGDEAWDDVLSTEAFAALVEHNITHHFRVAQKVSLMDGANLTLVTPATSHRSPAEEFALANFVKTTLHALTATLGAESERTVHHVPVNQVDLTRRARSEEPQNDAEEAEELVRFVNAVLLTAAPLPTPKESRYRSRIYRGNAITV